MKNKNKKHTPPTKAELHRKRNEDIRKEFGKWTSEPNHLDATYVVEHLLVPKYYLMPDTIWSIVNRSGHYKK